MDYYYVLNELSETRKETINDIYDSPLTPSQFAAGFYEACSEGEKEKRK